MRGSLKGTLNFLNALRVAADHSIRKQSKNMQKSAKKCFNRKEGSLWPHSNGKSKMLKKYHI
jgi:hypothetical protein